MWAPRCSLGRNQGWVGTQCPLNLDNVRSPYGHINQRLQIQFRAPDDERCAARAFNKLSNNKLYYKAASCWYFYWVIYDARIHEYQIFTISDFLTPCHSKQQNNGRTNTSVNATLQPLNAALKLCAVGPKDIFFRSHSTLVRATFYGT